MPFDHTHSTVQISINTTKHPTLIDATSFDNLLECNPHGTRTHTHTEIFTYVNFSVFTGKIERHFPLFGNARRLLLCDGLFRIWRVRRNTHPSASPHRIQCVFFIAISTAIEFVFLFRNALGSLFFQRRCIVSKGFRALSSWAVDHYNRFFLVEIVIDI